MSNINWFKTYKICILEFAQAFPGQGAVSNFSTGNGFGVYKGVLTALQIPFEIVHPKKWQKVYSIAKKTKEQSYAIASQLFPLVNFLGKKGAIKDGRSDAILMAEYGRRQLTTFNNDNVERILWKFKNLLTN